MGTTEYPIAQFMPAQIEAMLEEPVLTVELIELETRLITQSLSTKTTNIGIAGEPHLKAALDARPELSPEQVEFVATITRSGRRVEAVIAAAGTGKTFSLDAAADAWRRDGYKLIGASLAATAARQLQNQTGIPSDTIALRNIQLAEQTIVFDHKTVLIIDEAAICGTRQLAPLLDAARAANTKVVLVGDTKQLNAIEAGGMLHGLSIRQHPIALV